MKRLVASRGRGSVACSQKARRLWSLVGVISVVVVGCANPGATPSDATAGGAAGDSSDPSSEAGAPGSGGEAAAVPPNARVNRGYASQYSPSGVAASAGGETSQGGARELAFSVSCADGVVGDGEECDDGVGGAWDACTEHCTTRDQVVAASSSAPMGADEVPTRYLGFGRHPVAGGDDGFAVSYLEVTEAEPFVGFSIFNRSGQRLTQVDASDSANPVHDANPVAAALPGERYAVAWTDFDGDGSDLGIALRTVNLEGELSTVGFANAGRDFSQRDPDLLWAGEQLVAAWVDFSDPFSGPDVRYRLFDADLNPLSGDLDLAATDQPEAAVALAPLGNSFMAAYREGNPDGSETIVVKNGEHMTRIGPVLGGAIDDRPALVALDSTHALVVFSQGTDPNATGTANLTRLAYAVVDVGMSATLMPQSIQALDELWHTRTALSFSSPAVAAGPDGVFLAWRSEALPGDAAGDQLWLKRVLWNPTLGTLKIDLPEMLIPRTCEGSVGDQRTPALARTALDPSAETTPDGALAIAWEDYGRLLPTDSLGKPEVVVHFAPTYPLEAPAAAALFETEDWDTQASGASWGSRWTVENTGNFTVTTQRGAGQVTSTGGTLALEYLTGKAALNVDMVTEARLTMSSRAGLFARRTDADPTSYLAAQFGSNRDEPWRLYATIAGVQTDLTLIPPPNNAPVRAAEYAYRARFRVATLEGGDLFVAARIWPAELAEPTTWTLEKTLLASSAVAQQFDEPGRFGVLAKPLQNRKATFDAFVAKYFDGSGTGDLDAVPGRWPLPLARDFATARSCTPGTPCEVAAGCCEADADCAAGAACSDALSLTQPLGSHATACITDHCADSTKNADEQRADCGGADCAPCSCTVSATSGTAAYCPTTCPCGVADASCTQDAQCLPGLSCTVASGIKYGWPSGTGSCTPFHCANTALDFGETWPDCGGECGTCSVVEVTPSAGAISAATGALQKILATSPLEIKTVTNLAEGQSLCLFTESSQVTLDSVAFNRLYDLALTPNVPACFYVDAQLVLQSTNLEAESLASPYDLGNVDWQLSNETSQFQLSGTSITRWLATTGAAGDVQQTTASLRPQLVDNSVFTGVNNGGVVTGNGYLLGVGTASNWTFLQRPGVLFVVFRPDSAASASYLLGTVHDTNSSVGSGFGLYYDITTTPPRIRVRVSGGGSDYAYALNTTRSFPPGSKQLLVVSMTDSKLEAFKSYDSVGVDDTITGTLSTAAPYAVAHVGAKASTNKTPWPGALYEYLHFSGGLSPRARQAVVKYLSAKHGLN